MKYFTRSLWVGAQAIGRDENLDHWNCAFKEYAIQLEPLLKPLNPETLDLFKDLSVLHDGELLETHVFDGSRPPAAGETPRPWETKHNFPVKAGVEILDAYGEFVWHISYSAVRRAYVDFPAEPLFGRCESGFGDVGYHELTDAGDGFLRHEFLFASGAFLIFEFKKIIIAKERRSSGS